MHASGAERPAEQVEEVVADCVTALRAVADRDWEGVRAGRLEWDCRETAVHMASDLLAYAGQLAGRAQDAYIPFEITLDGTDDGLDPADNAGVLQVITTTGALLAATIRTTPRAVRAFHPYPFRHANREGFAAMGVAEVLLHTHDIAEGLGVRYEPPAEPASFVLTRIFPRVRPGPTPGRPCCGRPGAANCRGASPSAHGAGATIRCSAVSGSTWRASRRRAPPTSARAATAASHGSAPLPPRAPGWAPG